MISRLTGSSIGQPVKERIENPHHFRRPNEEPETVNPIGHWRTPSATAGDWQKIAMEFTGPCWGRRLGLAFAAVGSGTADFDDFSLRRLP